MQQLTETQAVAFAESKLWQTFTPEQIVKFQLFQNRLCMDFSAFHEAIEKVLNRPVFTHEFASPNDLIKEFLGQKQAPTFEEILDMIPSEKRIIITN